MQSKPVVRRSRIAKVMLAGGGLLVAIALLFAFARANPSLTVRAYFRAEQNLIAHWPDKWGKAALEETAIHKLTPELCRIGLLRPARIQVEPGVSFRLDPRDLIAVSIIRGGGWQ